MTLLAPFWISKGPCPLLFGSFSGTLAGQGGVHYVTLIYFCSLNKSLIHFRSLHVSLIYFRRLNKSHIYTSLLGEELAQSINQTYSTVLHISLQLSAWVHATFIIVYISAAKRGIGFAFSCDYVVPAGYWISLILDL